MVICIRPGTLHVRVWILWQILECTTLTNIREQFSDGFWQKIHQKYRDCWTSCSSSYPNFSICIMNLISLFELVCRFRERGVEHGWSSTALNLENTHLVKMGQLEAFRLSKLTQEGTRSLSSIQYISVANKSKVWCGATSLSSWRSGGPCQS